MQSSSLNKNDALKNTPSVYIGVSLPLSAQLHSTVGPAIEGKRIVSLHVFLNSRPNFQAYELGTFNMTPNGASETVVFSPSIPTPNAIGEFMANQLSGNLTVALKESNDRVWIEAAGGLNTSWTLGAVDMELLDPPLVKLP